MGALIRPAALALAAEWWGSWGSLDRGPEAAAAGPDADDLLLLLLLLLLPLSFLLLLLALVWVFLIGRLRLALQKGGFLGSGDIEALAPLMLSLRSDKGSMRSQREGFVIGTVERLFEWKMGD